MLGSGVTGGGFGGRKKRQLTQYQMPQPIALPLAVQEAAQVQKLEVMQGRITLLHLY